MNVLVIAEPGGTHEGSLDAMRMLLAVAALADAQVFKPQFCSNPERMCERRRAPEYLDSYRLLNYPVSWLETIAKDCEQYEMQLAVTVFLPEDAQLVAPFTKFIKVSSFEARDRKMLEAVNQAKRQGQRIIASTGMLEEHEAGALALYADILLACTSAYPAPVDAMNLATIREFHRQWGHKVAIGLSDHSRQPITGAVAVGVGATVIEAHLRLDSTPPSNRDYEVAFSPAEFTEYVRNIRLAERLMGSPDKSPQRAERAMMKYRVTG